MRFDYIVHHVPAKSLYTADILSRAPLSHSEKDRQYKERQKKDFDRRHRTRTLPPLLIDSVVWVNTQRNQVSGHVASPAATPIGRVRKNRANIIPQPTTTSSNSEPPSDDARMTTRSRSGILMRPPDRLTYY